MKVSNGKVIADVNHAHYNSITISTYLPKLHSISFLIILLEAFLREYSSLATANARSTRVNLCRVVTIEKLSKRHNNFLINPASFLHYWNYTEEKTGVEKTFIFI